MKKVLWDSFRMVLFWKLNEATPHQTNSNMRPITKKIVPAFLSGKSAKQGNTRTDGTSLFLHGNKIAYKENGKLFISTCGWDTMITKDRLNGIPGVRVNTSKGQLFLNGLPWDGDYIEVSIFVKINS
jgi:hypothetical protein